jgi:hypothetical protein
MSYVEKEKFPAEKYAPFWFKGIPFDDVNPEEDAKPLWSQLCQKHINQYRHKLKGFLRGHVGYCCNNVECGVYGCEEPAVQQIIFDGASESIHAGRERDEWKKR